MHARLRVTVIGAGAFGGWTALWLRRGGAEVTLLDAWGPGNSRASSGGETRVIRGTYGADPLYIGWVARALEVWRESQARWRTPLYRRTGALWMSSSGDTYAKASLPFLAEVGWRAEELPPAAARRRFPQIDFEGVESTVFEEEAGYLMARRACRAVAEALVEEGGSVREGWVRPGAIAGGEMTGLAPAREAADLGLRADVYVFACGPWLGELFPELLAGAILPTRQEVFFFGTPAGSGQRFGEEGLPVWMELGDPPFYGIPGNDRRGFKMADDTRGEPFDPTSGDRVASAAGLERARDFLARRFPALASAPLLESRVCQYENSPDGDFLIDRHPSAANVWLAGGGSGHGFKLGPAVGEHLARCVQGEAPPLPRFSLARLARRGGVPRTTQFERARAVTGAPPAGES